MQLIHRRSLRVPFLLLLLSFLLAYCTMGTSGSATSSRTDSRADMRLRSEVIDYAKKQLGAGYQYAGRDPRSGFDCSGLTHYVMKRFDVDLPTVSGLQAKEGRQVDVRRVQPGDLVFFKRSPGGRVFHVAMVVSNDRDGLQVIHSTSRGVVIDNVTDSSYWAPKLSSARDILTR